MESFSSYQFNAVSFVLAALTSCGAIVFNQLPKKHTSIMYE